MGSERLQKFLDGRFVDGLTAAVAARDQGAIGAELFHREGSIRDLLLHAHDQADVVLAGPIVERARALVLAAAAAIAIQDELQSDTAARLAAAAIAWWQVGWTGGTIAVHRWLSPDADLDAVAGWALESLERAGASPPATAVDAFAELKDASTGEVFARLTEELPDHQRLAAVTIWRVLDRLTDRQRSDRRVEVRALVVETDPRAGSRVGRVAKLRLVHDRDGWAPGGLLAVPDATSGAVLVGTFGPEFKKAIDIAVETAPDDMDGYVAWSLELTDTALNVNGTSIGLPFAVGLACLHDSGLDRPSSKLALTGRIDGDGRVHPSRSLVMSEKLEAALNAGISRVFLPDATVDAELRERCQQARCQIEVVDSIAQVVDILDRRTSSSYRMTVWLREAGVAVGALVADLVEESLVTVPDWTQVGDGAIAVILPSRDEVLAVARSLARKLSRVPRPDDERWTAAIILGGSNESVRGPELTERDRRSGLPPVQILSTYSGPTDGKVSWLRRKSLHPIPLDDVRDDAARRQVPPRPATYVDRPDELAVLAESWTRVSDRSGLVVLAGEEGIGKTTIINAFVEGLPADVRVLRADCEADDSDVNVLQRLLNEHLRLSPPALLRARLDQGASALADALPVLRRIFPGLAPSGGVAGPASLRAAAGRYLAALAVEAPLVIVAENLHNADERSLSLLASLAEEPGLRRGLLVVASAPTNHADAAAPLIELAGRMARGRWAVDRIDVAALAGEDLAELIQATFRYRTSPAELVMASRRSGGNPLYVSLASLDDLVTDGPPSPGPASVVGGRLEGLEPTHRRILAVAALIGTEFDVAVLGAAAAPAEGEEALGAALSALEHANLIVASGPSTHRFRHGLVQWAAAGLLGPTERARTEAAIAVALESRMATSDLAALIDIVRHLDRASHIGGVSAEDLDKLQRHAAQAGAELAAQGEHVLASTYYGKAIRACRRDADELVRLQVLFGEELRWAGSDEQALVELRKAWDLALELPAAVRGPLIGRIALAMAGPPHAMPTPAARGGNTDVVSTLVEAHAALGAGHSDLRRRLAARLVVERHLAGSRDTPAAQEELDAAVSAARQLGDSYEQAWALVARLLVHWGPEEAPAARLGLAQEALEAARDANEHALVGWSLAFCAIHCLELGRLGEVDELLREFTALSEEWAVEHGRWAECSLLAMRALLAADYPRADRLIGDAIRHWRGPAARQHYAAQRMLAARERGKRNHLENAILRTSVRAEAAGVAAFAAADALIDVVLGETEVARATFERLAANDFEDVPRDAAWLVTLCLAVELAAAFDDVARARVLFERLEPYVGRSVVIANAVACLGAVDRYVGLAAATVARVDPSWAGRAEEHLRRGIAWDRDRLEGPVLVAHGQLDLAWLLASDRRRVADARVALDEADAIAVALRLLPLQADVEHVAAVLEGGSVEPWPHGAFPSARRGRVSRERSRQILQALPSIARPIIGQIRPGRRGSEPVDGGRLAGALQSGLKEEVGKLGGAMVKVAQLIGSAPVLFPRILSDAFRDLLDDVPPLPFEVVREIIEAELGMPLDQAFSRFDEHHLAAASIAVVHRARYEDHEVVVKVVRPGIEDIIATDLQTADRLLARVLRGAVNSGTAMTLVRALADQLAAEVDLEIEAQNVEHFRAIYDKEFERLVVPQTFPERSSGRVLTMAFLPGRAIDRPESIAILRNDLEPLREILRAWFLNAVEDGVFHGDLHAGNLLVGVDADGRANLGIVDWGIVGDLDPFGRLMLRTVLEGALTEEMGPWLVLANLYRSAGLLTIDSGWRISDAAAAVLIRRQMRPILTSPIRDIDLTTLIVTPDDIRAVLAEEGRNLGPAKRIVANHLTRKREREAWSSGARGSDFDVSNWMLTKQLLYIQRFLGLYLPDESLVDAVGVSYLRELLGQSS